IEAFSVSAEALAELVGKVAGGELTTSRAREVLAAMVDARKPLADVIQAMGIASVDKGELENLCRELLTANPKVVQDVKEGKLKAVGSLIGQAKAKNPNVNPNQFRELCVKLIEKM
ncbi:MAG TPA: Asp-tRNA(Asn)/Glu-tRNA(Gln) amidotransferase GatCAB subunit B, partial [Planctomycetaceae bacterium]|nr:Asp-tRNA(Asn)/Glu-tRNA(Gln) amidotransferase GatCAB subunit B [Planctomycetaceae bacterium]